jgi:hypothetical protein
MKTEDQVQCIGWVEAVIEYKDGRKDTLRFNNSVMRRGRAALAAALSNSLSDGFNFYVSRMIFGDGGTSGGVPKFVDTNRNGLYGLTRASKPVVASVDPTTPSKAVFTSVLTFNDANGYALNEMALVMNSGDLYSLATFPDLNKTDAMQITWSWSVNFV